MAQSKGLAKVGKRVKMGRAMGNATAVGKGRVPMPEGGKKMPMHGGTGGKKVVTSKKGLGRY